MITVLASWIEVLIAAVTLRKSTSFAFGLKNVLYCSVC